MHEKLLLQVLLPAARRTFEFLVPLDLTVEQGARLMARVLAAHVPEAYVASDEVDLMHCEGDDVGRLIAPTETFRSLVLRERLMRGSAVALM